MSLHYYDIHSHLNLKPLADDVAGVVARMREKGVGTITVGTGLETSRHAIQLSEAYPDVLWATVGIHPTDSNEQFGRETFIELAQHPKVVAIGETGLDYFRSQDPDMKAKQAELFKKHIELAVTVGKPLMLHVRASKGSDDAYYDALKILKGYTEGGNAIFPPSTQSLLTERPDLARSEKSHFLLPLRANFHFFSGSKQCMEDIISAGYTISVDGPITFTHEYDDMIRACPIESLMAETDAPFAAPAPYRGKTCEPWMVEEVVKKIAMIKECSLADIQHQLFRNAQTFFQL